MYSWFFIRIYRIPDSFFNYEKIFARNKDAGFF